jgi:NAD(P)H-hydrate epimerase
LKVILCGNEKRSEDNLLNLERLKNAGIDPVIIHSAEELALDDQTNILVEALFGSGLNRPLDGMYRDETFSPRGSLRPALR